MRHDKTGRFDNPVTVEDQIEVKRARRPEGGPTAPPRRLQLPQEVEQRLGALKLDRTTKGSYTTEVKAELAASA